jgi:hypothetical protein
VDELHGDVTRVRARARPLAERDQAPATGETLRHQVADACKPLGLRLEERRVGARALGQRRAHEVGAGDRAHTATSTRA